MEIGYLIIKVYADNIGQPVEGALVTIEGEGRSYYTNAYGKTEAIALSAPDKKYSLEAQKEVRPYSIYTIKVQKKGLTTLIIEGVEILPGETSYQEAILTESNKEDEVNYIYIPDHVLWGDYPPKIIEEPIKDETENNTMRVMPEVLIPEYIIVHDGLPTNLTAPNYQVSFADYIKNVASSEIYSTWPTETIKANVYAIISFTLNRVFTEWYLSRGYHFTITSTTNFDQKFIYGRTIFSSIATIVDQIFNEYIKLPNLRQPFFAQYNDGKVVNNPGWLSQWGSKDLGDSGYSALQILRYYYPSNVYLEKTTVTQGLPTSFPGYNLMLGSCGQPVQHIQNQLNVINSHYPGIPKTLPADGIFGNNTKKSVEAFQEAFNLTKDGIVGFSTWYHISLVYIAVARLMENR